ncbi:MAG TPA: sigma 54-interacting response regulator [Chitinophagaceae bacterium]|nr:sigma 54-interacting response regulator [Chitinophagaceae bacterium]
MVNKKVLIVEDQFVAANDLQLILTKAGYVVGGIARSVPIAQEMIKKERPDLVLLDIFLKGKQTGIDLAKQLGEENIAFVYLSANSNEEVLNAAKATQPYGFLVKPFREKDLLIMLEIAQYRHEHSVESIIRKENIITDKLSSIISGPESWEKKLLNICRVLQPYISFDYLTAGFNTITESSNNVLSFLRIGLDEYQKIGVSELLTIARLKMNDLVTLVENGSLYELLSDTFSMKSCTSLPLHLSQSEIYTFSFYSRHADTYNTDQTLLLKQLQNLLTTVIESIFSKEIIRENVSHHLPSQTQREIQGFEGIIGKSASLLNVFDLITQVASSDTSVLILGESGTGKELIADCIHNLSPRKNRPFIKVNCAALPATLIESELFGHEKGAFTGALDKRMGKFEKADKGTIFLDEIGEMPVDLQVKLLRVLQEKYIERIGAKDTTKVDVRIIAATNRNLEKEVAEGRFRLDLYYRLNVFPIELPPLRERTEDIPDLADHFINHYNRKAGKKITGLSDKVLRNMTAYTWPGNIRELENLIERSVLLTKGTMIEDIALPAISKADHATIGENSRIKTIHENERDYIISVLKKCNGRIWGAAGAAEVLNLPPTTLTSKMKKLGIRKEDFN